MSRPIGTLAGLYAKASAERNELRVEVDRLRAERRMWQDMVISSSEHVAAITAELGLSYEAETETVLAAIRSLRDNGGA